MRERRVGTFTLGIGLLLFGILFIIRTFSPIISYGIILKLWPVILIILGCEILANYYKTKEDNLRYDKASIFLILLLSFFSMGMGFMQFVFEHAGTYIKII
jgi:hypothetical protein